MKNESTAEEVSSVKILQGFTRILGFCEKDLYAIGIGFKRCTVQSSAISLSL